MTVTVQAATAPSVFVVDDEPEMRMLARVFLETGRFQRRRRGRGRPAGAGAVPRAQSPADPVGRPPRQPDAWPHRTRGGRADAVPAPRPGDRPLLGPPRRCGARKAREIGIAACVSKMQASGFRRSSGLCSSRRDPEAGPVNGSGRSEARAVAVEQGEQPYLRSLSGILMLRWTGSPAVLL